MRGDSGCGPTPGLRLTKSPPEPSDGRGSVSSLVPFYTFWGTGLGFGHPRKFKLGGSQPLHRTSVSSSGPPLFPGKERTRGGYRKGKILRVCPSVYRGPSTEPYLPGQVTSGIEPKASKFVVVVVADLTRHGTFRE